MSIFLKRERGVIGGEYYFDKPYDVFEIAKRVTRGRYNTDQLKTTIPEGTTVADISLIIKKKYPEFDAIHFVTLAQSKEGYLFPDTYYFGSQAQAENIIETMTSTFNKKDKTDGGG